MAQRTIRDSPAFIRKYGLRVSVLPDAASNDHGGLGLIETIAWHHTAGASRGNYPSLSVVRYGRSDLPGPLAQYGLARDGTVIVFSFGLAYHAGAVRNGSMDNFNAVGIEAESTGLGDWTEEQIIAYPRLGAALTDCFDLTASRNLAHAEICDPPGRKIDAAQLPGGMDEQRRRVAALLKNGGTDMPLTDADKKWLRQMVQAEIAENNHAAAQQVWHTNVGNEFGKPDKDGSPANEPAYIALRKLEPRILNHIKHAASNK